MPFHSINQLKKKNCSYAQVISVYNLYEWQLLFTWKETFGFLMNMPVVDLDRRAVALLEWPRESTAAGKHETDRRLSKITRTKPLFPQSDLRPLLVSFWKGLPGHCLPLTQPNVLIWPSLTIGLQQLQVALPAKATTVIETAIIRRWNKARIPE